MGFWKRLFGIDVPSREEFAAIVMKEVEVAFPGKKLVYHPGEEFCLEIEGVTNFYLSNLYRDYCNAPRAQRSGVIAYYLSAFADIEKQKTPEYFEVERDRFFPHLRPGAFFSVAGLQVRARGMTDSLDYPSRPFAGSLVVTLVIDSPTSVGSVTQASLDRWGRSFEEVETAALENLFRATPGKLQQSSSGIYIAPWPDIYNGTRLLLPHLFENLDIDGDAVALVPTRETLLVTGSRNEKALQAFPALAEKAITEGRQLSQCPLVFRDGRWQELILPESHPAYDGLLMLKLQELAGDYTDQGKLLQQIEGDDYFVASFTVVQSRKTGKLRSYCVWSQGIPSILPRTDTVVLRKGEKNLDVYRWEDVADACGDLMQPLGLCPERYRVAQFPDDAIVAKIQPIES